MTNVFQQRVRRMHVDLHAWENWRCLTLAIGYLACLCCTLFLQILQTARTTFSQSPITYRAAQKE